MPYFIVADIGTQGTKTAVVDEKGRMVSSAFYPSELKKQPGGRVEQDPDEMFLSVVRGMREALALSRIAADNVAAIALDGQMAGILGIDERGNAVTPYDSWLDTRCEAYMPRIKAWGEDEIVRITGCPVTYSHGPKILWWKHERPDVYRRIAKFVVPSAFAAGRLAGLQADQAYIDYTHLHFSGFADTGKAEWSDALLKAFAVEKGKLPRIVAPWEKIGQLAPLYAQETGLLAGTPIVAGCGDTAAATLGAGIVKPGQLFDVAGTASVLSCCVRGYHPDAERKTLIYARSVVPDLWTPLAYINGGGQCLAWFRDQWNKREDGAERSFDDWNRLAAEVAAGSDGLLFVPHFGGRVCPNDPDLRGSWLGLEWAHDQSAMYRSILESVAYEYRYYLDTLERLAGDVAYSRVTAVGGGARGQLFNSIKADVLGIPYETLKVNDTALIANAVIAGYGVGLYRNLGDTAQRFAVADRVYAPDAANRAVYERNAERYRIAIDGLGELYRKLK
ncbi:FGGY-family carbohydrate kinase [Cohnella cellulosilytica]|uniref:FGGY-family carbohydrate kinase n=2 Tax=Cohnella cellulosilytica TaxID=986710 RepID=A0ABW2FJ88_9BACL